MGWGESKSRARQTAWLSLFLALGMTLLFAVGRLG
jgi:hypothetical protein